MNMFKWEHPEFFWLLLLLLPVLGLFVWFMWWRNQQLKKLGDTLLVERLTPDSSPSKQYIKFIFLFVAILFMVLGAANLQSGSKMEKVKREGIDLIFALDVSRSMYAQDVQPNRLSRSKLFISRVIENLKGDRIGLVVFAGNAYQQLPITTDYAAGKLLLESVDPEMIPTQGTAIGDAIRKAVEGFNIDEDDNEGGNRAIIVISDGENHEGDALEAIKEAQQYGITVYTVGVGSKKGSPIPVYKNGKQVDYKRDGEGNYVLSKLNEEMLAEIAKAGNGSYYPMKLSSEQVNNIIADVALLEKTEIEERVFTDYEDRFQIFLAVAFILLTLEYLLSERRLGSWEEWKITSRKKRKAA